MLPWLYLLLYLISRILSLMLFGLCFVLYLIELSTRKRILVSSYLFILLQVMWAQNRPKQANHQVIRRKTQTTTNVDSPSPRNNWWNLKKNSILISTSRERVGWKFPTISSWLKIRLKFGSRTDGWNGSEEWKRAFNRRRQENINQSQRTCRTPWWWNIIFQVTLQCFNSTQIVDQITCRIKLL